MDTAINKRNYWIVLVVAGILAIAVTLIQQKWLPDYDLAAFLIAMTILGVAFFWVYTIDKEALWWALIPALVMLTLFVTGIVGYLTPKDASGSSPYGVITLGLGAAIIGWVLKRPAAKLVLYVIAVITLLVGILMLPLDLIWKLLLYAVVVVVIGYLIWQTTRQLAKK
ncbi:MAG: hypothetical protein A2Z71_05405 [Chloroflexi bacterium RBG_13_50_21]|nr:MAG: hypothetical protein A2Z71_05405 [Chloroflexi bacterium RBG_13_50_21]